MIHKKTLYLILKKEPFEVTASLEKKIEYRRNSKWILSRLVNKTYDEIKFTHGYGNTKPYAIFEYNGWSYTKKASHSYSNGLIVHVNDGDIEINIGKLIKMRI